MLCFNLVYKSGEAGDGSALCGGACVAAGAFCREFNVGLALFENSHHGEIAVNTADWLGNYGSALVANKEQLDAASFKLVHDFRSAVSRPFLGAGGGKIGVDGGVYSSPSSCSTASKKRP